MHRNSSGLMKITRDMLYEGGKQTPFYKNCRTARKCGYKICNSCPFRSAIVKFEADQDEDRKQFRIDYPSKG